GVGHQGHWVLVGHGPVRGRVGGVPLGVGAAGVVGGGQRLVEDALVIVVARRWGPRGGVRLVGHEAPPSIPAEIANAGARAAAGLAGWGPCQAASASVCCCRTSRPTPPPWSGRSGPARWRCPSTPCSSRTNWPSSSRTPPSTPWWSPRPPHRWSPAWTP